MVPNVYGMSQFADGGMLATKPYISSSRYLIKMGAKKEDNKMKKETLLKHKEVAKEFMK